MRATVTSKGQVPLPKKIRDALGIESGTQLDFRLVDGDRIEARRVDSDPMAIVGLLERPGRKPVSIEAMNEAVATTVRRRNRSARR